MRRSDREITDPAAMETVILKSKVCKLAMCDGNHPYIVPLCFGFKDNTLYFHSAGKGKKIEILKKNPRVCFEFEILTQVIQSATACKCGMKYRSVIGYGKVEFITDEASKRQAFDIIMRQYTDAPFSYDASVVTATTVMKVAIERMTGKRSDI